MQFLYKIFSNLAKLGLSAIGLGMVAFAGGLAYQIDVAANIWLGWGYIAYIVVLVALQAVLIRSLVVNNNGVSVLLIVPNGFLLLMIFARVMTSFKKPFFENIASADYHFWGAIQGFYGPILHKYGAIFLLVVGCTLVAALLAWVCHAFTSKGSHLWSFKPAWQNGNADMALKAVEKESDQEKLKEIAQKAPHNATRAAAVHRITDQSFLLDIARNDKNTLVRKTAVTNLAEESVLASIAKTEKEITVCKAAVEKLKDQALLADIAKQTFDHRMHINDFVELCNAAIQKLTDQRSIADVANNAPNNEVRWIALGKLDDAGLLAIITNKADNANLVRAALEKLTDQKMLAELAASGANRELRMAAMGKLTDQSILAEIAVKNSKESFKAITIISDKSLLMKIFEQAKNRTVKEEAMRKLGGYACASCKQRIWPVDEQPAPCVCSHCQAENHQFVHRNDITEYRDYEVGSRWKECVRCGKKIDYESVNTM